VGSPALALTLACAATVASPVPATDLAPTDPSSRAGVTPRPCATDVHRPLLVAPLLFFLAPSPALGGCRGFTGPSPNAVGLAMPRIARLNMSAAVGGAITGAQGGATAESCFSHVSCCHTLIDY
jgi:hypothetical protein